MSNGRISLYFAWSRSKETGVDLGMLENRFPTLFELRRAIWPIYEFANDRVKSEQGIAGFLDEVILFDFQQFVKTLTQVTGHRPEIVQREEAGHVTAIDDSLLRDINTLIVISLDHFRTEQRPTMNELAAIQHFLEREGAWLVVCPHHNIGTDGQASREIEFKHHNDRLVPAQQGIGGFGRSLLAELGYPIANRYGLSPAPDRDGGPAPLDIAHGDDEERILEGVTTFNLHPHLPHLDVPLGLAPSVRVLARQLINPQAGPHPFVDAGNRFFNALLHIPPEGRRAAHILVCDATLWSAAFGGTESLRVFWRNLALK